MDRTELVENLNAFGLRLTTQAVGSDDIAKGVGWALLGLSELIGGRSADEASAAAAKSTFKAKANRW